MCYFSNFMEKVDKKQQYPFTEQESKQLFNSMPLCAIIDGKDVISIDVPESEWKELKKKCRMDQLSVTMIGCDHPGHLVTKDGLQFFRHDPRTLQKNCEHETIEHLKWKIKIFNYCRSFGWKAKPEANCFGGLWRPDVLACSEKKRIAFEVQLSPIALEKMKERHEIRKQSQVDTYWLLSKIPRRKNEYVEDSSSIPDFCEPSQLEEIVFFILEGIQTKKITSNLELEKWVSLILTGEYQRILHDGVAKFKVYNTIERRMKSARDQLEILKTRFINHSFDNLKIPPRMKKIIEMPQFDKKIETINHVWDAFENLRRNIDRLESKINDPSTDTDDSKIDGIYKTLDSAKQDEQAYRNHAKCYKQICNEETDFDRFNFQEVLDIISERE